MQMMAGAPHGGAEAFFVRLVAALGRAGLSQRAVIRHDAERAAALRDAGVAVTELRLGGPLDLMTTPRLKREISEFAPDAVLTWMGRATRHCPRGPFVHAARLGGYYKLDSYRRCDHLVANTRGIARYLVEQGWPQERVHYLPNFVDAKPLRAMPRARLQTPDDAPLLLALGRLHRNKAFDVLIEALTTLPDVWLWLAGEGPLAGELAALAGYCGVARRVRFLGWRDDVAALLAAADVLVCPSRHEPLGNVVIEGWAHGVPVVAAASAGPAELIDDGETGLLVPVDATAALAAVLARLSADKRLRRRLAKRGRAAYAAAYTRDAVVRRYLDFFERVTS
ncbi:MAG: glycosyltransferase [Alphaproteobacteria bacterium]